MKKIFQDPLSHFVGLGLLLFVLFAVVGSSDGPELDDQIRVDEETLLTFIQYRSRNFDREMAQARLAALDPVALDRLIDEYVREEVLYREGLALGLDSDDYVIRRRLIQKVEFLAEGFVNATTNLSDEDITAYFEANKQDYYVSPSITFTHVFFDKAKRGSETRALADAALLELNEKQVPFAEAPAHGDRFPFHLNYVERTPEFVASHFGQEMAEAVFSLPVDEDTWKGVFVSPYGAHLVLVSSREVGRDANLDDVRARVREDAAREQMTKEIDAAVANITQRYDVDVDLPESSAGSSIE